MIIQTTSEKCFTLESNRMIEVPLRHPYSATRAAIRSAFRGESTIVYKIGETEMIKNLAAIRLSTNRIKIGCCVFTGKDFLALKRWAKKPLKRKAK